jgi:hypothetical protein
MVDTGIILYTAQRSYDELTFRRDVALATCMCGAALLEDRGSGWVE